MLRQLSCALCTLLAAFTLTRGSAAEGEDRATPPGTPTTPTTGSNALAGIDRVGFPTATPLSVAGDVGYGHVEALRGDSGPHHRMDGSLAISVPAASFLAAALRLRGRFDVHPEDAQGADDSLSGVPELTLRAFDDRQRFAYGAELTARFPGRDAPSIDFGATSLEARALFAYLDAGSPLSAGLSAGYRLENGEQAAPDRSRLRAGDRIALGLSEFDAVLIAAAGEYRIGDGALLLEASTDLFLGAPSLGSAPKRVSAGYRHDIGAALELVGLLSANLNRYPDTSASAPLVAVEPRFGVSLGLRYAFGTEGPAPEAPEAAPAAPSPEPAAPVAPPPAAALPESTSLAGVITDAQGNPLPQVDVTLRSIDEQRKTTTDAGGRYYFPDVPFGKVALHVETVDYLPQEVSIDVGGDGSTVEAPAIALEQEALAAQIQGLVRSFDGAPLAAKIEIAPLGAAHATDADGRFSVDVDPGAYTITISAPGYVSQTHVVNVNEKAVIVVNADLRKK